MTDFDPSCDLPGERGPELAGFTTLRVGGPIGKLRVAGSAEELVAIVDECDQAGEPVLVIGGGSNTLAGDRGFPGTVVLIASRGIRSRESGCTGAEVEVEAGEPWDAFVAYAIARDWIGIEALSGIPGLVGATPIQNVGAYGAEVAETITRVRTWDRHDRAYRTFTADQCGFGYRWSRFKADPGRYLVLQVHFQFLRGSRSAPIKYGELARRLGVEVGERADTTAVRQAVWELRAGKGMVLNPIDHDSWSLGSFFTNPLLTPDEAARLPEDAPRFPATGPDGSERVKSSAAWLIDHAGFAKGYGSGPATLSTKHTLALTNRGHARAADVLALAREIRDGVEQAFGVRLVPEPVLVGCEL